jgi:GDP-D-mannose 3',5'-epimerase
MGFISVAECEVLRNNALINIHTTHTAAEMGVPRCGAEEQRLALSRVEGSKGAEANLLCTSAPLLPSSEGREKAPAAICRKVAMAEACTEPCPERSRRESECDGGTIPVWGDGTAIRAYTYVDDLVEGVYMLMQSDLERPTIIGSDEYVTVDEAASLTADGDWRLRQGDSREVC